MTLLIENLLAEPRVSGFPPPLHYRIVLATVSVYTQTETPSVLPSGYPFEFSSDEVMTVSGADHGFSPAADALSPSPYSPSSPSYSTHPCYLSRYSLFPPYSPTDYSPTSPYS